MTLEPPRFVVSNTMVEIGAILEKSVVIEVQDILIVILLLTTTVLLFI